MTCHCLRWLEIEYKHCGSANALNPWRNAHSPSGLCKATAPARLSQTLSNLAGFLRAVTWHLLFNPYSILYLISVLFGLSHHLYQLLPLDYFDILCHRSLVQIDPIQNSIWSGGKQKRRLLLLLVILSATSTIAVTAARTPTSLSAVMLPWLASMHKDSVPVRSSSQGESAEARGSRGSATRGTGPENCSATLWKVSLTPAHDLRICSRTWLQWSAPHHQHRCLNRILSVRLTTVLTDHHHLHLPVSFTNVQ